MWFYKFYELTLLFYRSLSKKSSVNPFEKISHTLDMEEYELLYTFPKLKFARSYLEANKIENFGMIVSFGIDKVN